MYVLYVNKNQSKKDGVMENTKEWTENLGQLTEK